MLTEVFNNIQAAIVSVIWLIFSVQVKNFAHFRDSEGDALSSYPLQVITHLLCFSEYEMKILVSENDFT